MRSSASQRRHTTISMKLLQLAVLLCVGTLVVGDERPALVALYRATGGGTTWTTTWPVDDNTSDHCTWGGVTCSGGITGNVVQLLLNKTGLSGTLPVELGTLTSLNSLQLYDNAIVGTIPSSYSGMTSMGDFAVNNNKLTGTLPPELSAWRSLFHFIVNGNSLTGTLPPSYASWTNLTWFYAKINQLSGSLPAEYAAWTRLTNFGVAKNSLTGTIPDYPSWKNVDLFDVSTNFLTGTLPSMETWRVIDSIYTGSNRLTGTMPQNLPTTLTVLMLFNNSLEGTLPAQLSHLSKLTDLQLQFNKLEGILPPEYSELKAVLQWNLGHNNLSGTLPSSWSLLTSVQSLLLQDNPLLSGEVPASWVAAPGMFLGGSSVMSVCGTSVCGTKPSSLFAFVCFPTSLVEIPIEEGLPALMGIANPSFVGPACDAPTTPHRGHHIAAR